MFSTRCYSVKYTWYNPEEKEYELVLIQQFLQSSPLTSKQIREIRRMAITLSREKGGMIEADIYNVFRRLNNNPVCGINATAFTRGVNYFYTSFHTNGVISKDGELSFCSVWTSELKF